MKGTTHSRSTGKRHKSPPHAKSEMHATGSPYSRVALPEVEVFTDSADSTEVQAATRDLRDVHDAQVADDDFQ